VRITAAISGVLLDHNLLYVYKDKTTTVLVRKPIGAKALVLFAFPLYESIPLGNSILVALRRATIVSKAVGIGNAGFLGCGPLKRTSPLPFSPQTLFWPLGPL
jgi:hypothetical protein